jgi:uncharacterized membrane protein YbhN (UPF0104 family)
VKPVDDQDERTADRGRARSWFEHGPDLSVRFYSSSADAPRARRPTDVILFLLAAAALTLVQLFASDPTALGKSTTQFVKALPGLLGWFWEIGYDLLVVWSIVLLIASIIARRRLFLFRDQVLATALALVAATLVAGGWSDLVDGLTRSAPPPVHPAARLALATALIATTAPHLGRPVRQVGRWVIVLGAIAGVALGIALPSGVVAGLAIGFGAAAAMHLAFGSPGGRPSLDQVAAALRELGVEAEDLRPAEFESKGVVLVRASTPEGRQLVVKVYGRDAWDGQLLTSTWSYLWYRDEAPALTLSRRQQVEHEAFVTLLAERAGVRVSSVVAAGIVGERDSVLVVEGDGRPLQSLAADEVSDDLLRGLWRVVNRMHEAGIVHGGLDAQRLFVLSDDSPGIGGFQAASAIATPQSLLSDRAQLLVTSALLAGDERALQAAVETIGVDGVAEMLPYLQAAALTRSSRQAMKEASEDLDALREHAASAAGAEPPKLEPLRRVSVGSVLTAAVVLLAAYFIITAIAGIRLDTIVSELEEAEKGWIWAGLMMSPLVQVGQAFSTLGAAPLPLRLGPVLGLEYAIQFIALAVPSSAARVAMNVRFFERQGAPATQALTIGLLDSVGGFVVQILLILVIVLSGMATLNLSLDGLDIDPTGTLLVLAGILVVVAIIVAITVPKIWRPIAAKLSEARPVLRVVRSPTKLTLILGGNLVAQLLLAIVLGLTVHAFGQSATLGELLLINTGTSLLAGVIPVPGGIGVTEGALAAGLTAIGIPSSTAVSIAIVNRLLVFYLPPIWGAFAMKWLRRQEYL